jgi:DNA-binding transcriptional MerR regulator/methylmalonyl-CoA mutase cobalamin-binding subunit
MSSTNPSTEPRYPIQVAARRSGLNPDLIRVWERRYGAVEPSRSTTNRRLYSDRDIERLLLLGQITRAGHRIGDVATLPLDELESMAVADRFAAARAAGSGLTGPKDDITRTHFEVCVDAIQRMDGPGLEALVENAAVDLASPVLLEEFLMPLLVEIGRLWQDGTIRIAHEHVATATVRSFLGTLQRGKPVPLYSPELIAATPAGQLHELGALMVAVAAAADGWRVTYLGADLPAGEIAAAALSREARAVALSIVHPPDDPHLSGELRTLGRHLIGKAELIVGGAAATGYEAVLTEVDARVITEVSVLRTRLQSLRSTPTMT